MATVMRRKRVVFSSESESEDEFANNDPPWHLETLMQLPDLDQPSVHNEAANDVVDVSSDSGSSDSQDPVSRKARKLAMREAASTAGGGLETPAFGPLQFAAKYGHFPFKSTIVGASKQRAPPVTVPSEDGFLWNSKPPKTCQYLDMEAENSGYTSSGTTGSSESDSSLSDFIDKSETLFTAQEAESLSRAFPVTSQRFLKQPKK